jgi:hypothetical protein
VSDETSESSEFPPPPDGFLTYQEHTLVAVLDDPDSVQASIDDLIAAGFPRDGIAVLSGPAGAARLDVAGRHHGLRGKVYRLLEHVSDVNQWLKHHSDHLRAGAYGIAVSADPDRKDEAARIVSKHGAHDAAYFDTAYWESL